MILIFSFLIFVLSMLLTSVCAENVLKKVVLIYVCN